MESPISNSVPAREQAQGLAMFRVTAWACVLILAFALVTDTQAATLVSKRVGEPLVNVTANGHSEVPSISGDGTVIAFRTEATNLLGPNSPPGLYVLQRPTGVLTHLSSLVPGDLNRPVLSSDGRYVAFQEIDVGEERIVRHDLLTGERLVVVSATAFRNGYDMSVDGQFITVVTNYDLIGDGLRQNLNDLFLYDTQTQTLQNITANLSSQVQEARISGDGRFVAYHIPTTSVEDQANGLLEGYFLYDSVSGQQRMLDAAETLFSTLVIDGGTHVGVSLPFPNETQSVIHDIELNTTQVVEGVIAALSEDGTQALMDSSAALDGVERSGVQSFLLDLRTGAYTHLGPRGFSALSTDGVLWVFGSRSANEDLPGLNNNEYINNFGLSDVFLFDGATGDFELITRGQPTSTVEAGRGDSWDAAISGAGDLVAFSSSAEDLTAGDTNLLRDIFLVDRSSGSTENSTRNLTSGGNGESFDPVLSKDGRVLAYVTAATNLAGADANGATHDIVLQALNGDPILVTRGADGPSSQPHLSRDGRWLTFASSASNLAPGDSNGALEDVFLYDRDNGTTMLLTAGTAEASTAPSISADGRFVVFRSLDENLVAGASLRPNWNLFVYEIATGDVRHVNRDTNLSLDFSRPILSPNGRWVAVHSQQFSTRTLLPASLFLFDLQNDTSVNLSENSFTDFLLPGEFSADSQTLVFSSRDQNLVTPDTNGFGRDIFLYDLASGDYQRVFDGANENSGGPAMSDDASIVVFDSTATNIAPDNNGEFSDVFLVDLSAPNATPTADAASFEVAEDGSVTFTLTGSDPDGDVLAFEIVSQPVSGFVSGAADGVASSFSYQPNPNFNGQDFLSFSVNDGQSTSAPATVSFTVLPVNDAPSTQDQSLQVISGGVLTIALDAQDIDSADLSFNIVDSPARGELSATAGSTNNTLSYTSESGFVGTDSFSYNVSDGQSTSAVVGRVTITVTSVTTDGNRAPQAGNSTVDLAGLDSILFTPPATDPDCSSCLTGHIVDGPTNGTLSGEYPSLRYTPNPGFDGEDSLTFFVNDGQVNSGVGTVRFLVGTPQLFSAVLPSSRSVGVGVSATVFTTVINDSGIVAEGCSFALTNNPGGMEFSYAQTDSANQIVGDFDAPFEIAPNSNASFVMLLRSDQPIAPVQLRWAATCSRGTGTSAIDGVNTLQFSAAESPSPDLLAIAATLQNDGVMHMQGDSTGNSTGVAGIAAVNIGAAGTLSVRPRVTSAPDLGVTICATNPVTGACIEPASLSLSQPFAADSVLTYSVFATTSGSLALDPANRRIFVEFFDEGGSLRGSTSIAVESSP